MKMGLKCLFTKMKEETRKSRHTKGCEASKGSNNVNLSEIWNRKTKFIF